MKHAIFSITAALAFGAAASLPLAADAASDHRLFEGTVVHVSSENIKVHGVEGGVAKTISFLINHGTKMRHSIHAGEYVRVIFDQRFLGIRHADSVDPYGARGMKIKS
jgi:hypothetical protein